MRTDRKLGLILSWLALIASTINLIGLFVDPAPQPLQSILLAVNGAVIGSMLTLFFINNIINKILRADYD